MSRWYAIPHPPQVFGGQGTNDRKKNQQRHQQSMWDKAKRIEGRRRRAIFSELKADAHKERVKGVFAQYAEFLQQHPSGFTPGPSRRQQKLLGAEQAAAQDAAAAEPPPAEEPAPPASSGT